MTKATPGPMTMERAREITGRCVESSVSVILGPEYKPLPDGVSLEEMLVANRMVEQAGGTKNADGTTSYQMVVDPRGIALHYAFEQYGSDPRQLLEALGYTFRDE